MAKNLQNIDFIRYIIYYNRKDRGDLMFGYVKPFVPELKMIENQYYRAAYCGLCRAMQTETGFFSRMSLSYDVAFLVLLRLALTGEIPVFEKKRCFVHPFRKKLSMKSSDSLQYSASVGALLTMHKLRDDAIDERGFDRLFAIILKAFFKKSYKKAVVQTGDLDVRLRLKLEELRRIEQASERSADRPAAVFGDIMADILSFGLEKEDDRIIAVSLGIIGVGAPEKMY